MRVLLVSQPLDGGVYRHVMDLCSGLSERGHRVALAAPWTSTSGDDTCYEPLRVPLQRAVSAPREARAVTALALAVDRWAPDVVHAHSSKAGAAARLARCARPGTPVVYTPHGFAFAGHFSPRRRRVYRAAERVLAPLTSAVVAVCEAERTLAEQVHPSTRVRVVHNGVMTADVVGTASGRPVLTALAHFRPGKGLLTLLDAMPSILEHVPDAQLRLVGDGPERRLLERRVQDLGIREHVDMPGAASDARSALHGTSVFVHPSWAESFPYAVLDAMALGLPVVATDVGGVSEAVRDGLTGRLVRPHDPSQLSAAVVPLLLDLRLAARLGEAGREAVRAFSVDDMVEQTEAVYESVERTPR